MVVVELASRAIQIAVMVEEVQTTDKLLFAATHEFDEPIGADEAVLGDVAEDFEVALLVIWNDPAASESRLKRGSRCCLSVMHGIVSRMKPLQVVERLLDSSCHRHFSAVR
jgi:hypothetical protein